MNPTHYADVMIREGEVALELHARLLLVVHQQVAGGRALAAAWPDWRERPGEFGLVFRVFGDPDALSTYLNVIAPLATAGLIRPYPVAPVPDTSRHVRYLRDRSADATSPSAARRLARRAEARGEVWEPKQARRIGDHHLTLPSMSRHQTFRIFLRRDPRASTATAAGASYGLGHLLPDF